MAQTPNNTISTSFAVSASPNDASSYPGLSDMLDASVTCKDMPDVQEIVAAILSQNHALSAEQLHAFETLLDASDSDDKQALLQTIWNVVICIIDYQWEHARLCGTSGAIACGSTNDAADDITKAGPDMVEYSQSEIEGEHDKTAAQSPRRKGCDDT